MSDSQTTAPRPRPYAPGTSVIKAGEPSGPSPVQSPGSVEPPVRFGLTWRLFLAIAGVVSTVLVITLVVTALSASRAADRSIAAGLRATAVEIDSLLERESRGMAEKASIYFDANTAIKAEVEAASDSTDYTNTAVTAVEVIGADWLQLIGADGVRLARSDEPGAERADLSGSPLVSAALGGGVGRGFGLTNDSVLFDAVTAPIVGATGVVGVVMAARTIDDDIADRIGARTGSEIIFYTLDSASHPRIVAASRGINDRSAAAAAMEAQMMRDGPPALDTAGLPDSSTTEVVLGGVHYVGSARPLTTAARNVVGGVVALRDKDAILAPFRRLQVGILGAGGLGLLIAFALSLSIANQIARPVRALAAATRRASEGDYEAEIPHTRGDEIGSLARAFKRLLGDLREKQALVEFLQSPSGGRTLAVESIRPTLQMAMAGGTMLEPGQSLAGRYEIKSILGVGGMGMVYKAVDLELGEVVAIKTLKPELMSQDSAALDRFRSEIRLARRISHRNVVRTHDIGESAGLYFITMEFVEGRSLKELIVSRGRLPAAAVIPIARQLCRALEVAHEAGVIHRDIKPHNMVVEGDGVLKVMDFGIARLAHRKDGHTQAGMVVGTPDYMAPEQLMGDDIDARADLYAVGVVLYECLTGRLPHIADTPITLIAKVLDETPTPPRSLSADVPAPLSDLVMRALSKKPDGRPKGAGEMLRLLEQM